MTRSLVLLAIVVGLVASCSDDAPETDPVCCPIDSDPCPCDARVGGSAPSLEMCAAQNDGSCDGFWEESVDGNGCPVFINRFLGPGPIMCGVAPVDASDADGG